MKRVDFAGNTILDPTAASPYAWDFGASGNLPTSGSTVANVQFNNIGTFTVRYTVTDARGQSHSATRGVTVNANALPEVQIDSPLEAQVKDVGIPFTFESKITDDGGHEILWIYGDGDHTKENQENPGAKSYTTAGDYVVELRVTDEINRWSLTP